MEETAEDAGITKQVHPHLRRHPMATRLVNRGMPLEHVRKVLGHESIETVRISAETETESVKERFDSVMGMGE